MDFPIHETPESTKSNFTKLLQQEISKDEDSDEKEPEPQQYGKSEERLQVKQSSKLSARNSEKSPKVRFGTKNGQRLSPRNFLRLLIISVYF